MLCNLCKGPGNLVTFGKGNHSGSFIEWQTCPKCDGSGCSILFGPPTIKIHTAGKSISNHQEFSIKDFPENALMAHVMSKAGLFTSISQARKNGWDKPITTGTFVVTKKRNVIVVTE